MSEQIDWVAVARNVEKAAQAFTAIGDVVAQIIDWITPVIPQIAGWIEDLARSVAPDFLGIPSSDIRSVTFSDPILICTYNWRTIELPMTDLARAVKL